MRNTHRFTHVAKEIHMPMVTKDRVKATTSMRPRYKTAAKIKSIMVDSPWALQLM